MGMAHCKRVMATLHIFCRVFFFYKSGMGTESVFTQDRLKNICELERTAGADHAPSTDVTSTVYRMYTECILYTVVFYKLHQSSDVSICFYQLRFPK